MKKITINKNGSVVELKRYAHGNYYYNILTKEGKKLFARAQKITRNKIIDAGYLNDADSFFSS